MISHKNHQLDVVLSGKVKMKNADLFNVTLKTLETGLFGLDGGSMFGVVPKALWVKSYTEPDEENRIPLSSRILYIEFEDRKILVDTGNGTKFNEKLRKIYKIDVDKSNIFNVLSKINLKPEDITDVILTHLHFDHCGGSTVELDGKIVPSFPNAKYYVQKEQWDWALNPTEKDAGSFMKNDYVPLYEFDKLEFTEGNTKIAEIIEIMPMYGHTPAMQTVKLNINGQIYFFASDLIPTSAHLNLPYILAFDNFPLITLKEKKVVLSQAIEEDWIIIFEHDAFLSAGRIGLKDGKYFVREKVVLY